MMTCNLQVPLNELERLKLIARNLGLDVPEHSPATYRMGDYGEAIETPGSNDAWFMRLICVLCVRLEHIENVLHVKQTGAQLAIRACCEGETDGR